MRLAPRPQNLTGPPRLCSWELAHGSELEDEEEEEMRRPLCLCHRSKVDLSLNEVSPNNGYEMFQARLWNTPQMETWVQGGRIYRPIPATPTGPSVAHARPLFPRASDEQLDVRCDRKSSHNGSSRGSVVFTITRSAARTACLPPMQTQPTTCLHCRCSRRRPCRRCLSYLLSRDTTTATRTAQCFRSS